MYQFLFVLSLIYNVIEKKASSCKKGEYGTRHCETVVSLILRNSGLN